MSTVLVVDDSSFDRDLVRRVLADEPGLTIELVENGLQALDRLRQGGIDLVVTDLQMPEVNGLQLVTTIRVDHPQVPVILMTGQGSEVVAIEALEQGAASYVPKRVLQERLTETVQDVLAIAHAGKAYQQLLSCFNSTEFDLSLGNDAKLIDPLVDLIQQMVTGMKLCDATGGYQVGVALREALLNAIYRGNLEIAREESTKESERLLQGQRPLADERREQSPYTNRRVHVALRVGRDEARFVIRDEGSGFDVQSMPAPTDPSALEPSAGRGLVLMRTSMDDVVFNETGNQVTLVKRRSAENA